MSDQFSDREKGFERKYQLDQEQVFKVQVRRDKLFGLWVAGQLGKSGADADSYAKEVVSSNFEKPGDEDMLGKVRGDLKAAGKALDDKLLKAELNKAESKAVDEVKSAK
jgi:hypothetical protein